MFQHVLLLIFLELALLPIVWGLLCTTRLDGASLSLLSRVGV